MRRTRWTMSSLLIASSLLFVSCTSGNCRSQRESSVTNSSAKTESSKAAPASASAPSRIKVFKYDGGLQCGQGKAIPVAEMQKELSGITVYSAENKADNLMHIQACGTPTGRANVYEIDRSQLSAAQKKGFKEWTFE